MTPPAATRGTSNTLTYLIILGVTLSIIAYALSTFLQFQLQIKGPIQQSLNATSRSAQEFQAAMSDGWGLSPAAAGPNATPQDPGAATLSIEAFPPYFSGAPALFQITLANPTGATVRIEKTRLEAIRENATIPTEPGELGPFDLAYRKTKDAQFTPQEPGNYTLRATILQKSTLVKTAERRIFVSPPPNARPAASFSGTADFSLNTTTQELFRYELKSRRFLAAGSGNSWRVTIPRSFNYTEFHFLNHTKNANIGIGNQFFEAGGAYFNTKDEGGYDALLTTGNIGFQPNTTADYMAFLAASACPAAVLLHYENSMETRNLSTGTEICPLEQQCANSRQVGVAKQRQSCGESSKRYLHAFKARLRAEKLVAVEVRPGCALYLAGTTLGTTRTHDYGPPSAAHLLVQNASLVYVNGRQHPHADAENFNTAFQKIDLTDNALSGETEFNISTDSPLSFAPYLLYSEILGQATSTPNFSGKVQGSKLILTPGLASRTEDFSRQFSYNSAAGSCYSETGLWGFGAAIPEAPEAAIGTLSLRLSTSFDWPSNSPPTVSTKLTLSNYETAQTASQAEASGGKAIVSIGGYNAPQDGTPALLNSIAHADTDVNLNYASSATLRSFFGAVEATDWRYIVSGITDTTRTIKLPENLIGLYLILKSDLPSIKYPAAVAGVNTNADLLGGSYSARGYKQLRNGWNPQGYSQMELTEGAAFADLSQKALPKQQVSLRIRTETDTPNTLESSSAEVHLIAISKRPMRVRIHAGNQTFYRELTEAAEIPLEDPNGIRASADGTGTLRGVLEATSIKDTQATVQPPVFSKATLLIEPSGRITNLQIMANNRAAKAYAELSNVDKADLSQFLVPELQNTIEFRGEGGALNWKLIFE